MALLKDARVHPRWWTHGCHGAICLIAGALAAGPASAAEEWTDIHASSAKVVFHGQQFGLRRTATQRWRGDNPNDVGEYSGWVGSRNRFAEIATFRQRPGWVWSAPADVTTQSLTETWLRLADAEMRLLDGGRTANALGQIAYRRFTAGRANCVAFNQLFGRVGGSLGTNLLEGYYCQWDDLTSSRVNEVVSAIGYKGEGLPEARVASLEDRDGSRSALVAPDRDPAADAGPRVLASGSGFVVSPAGWVVTNDHVIEACGAVRVARESGAPIRATVAARDPVNDLALLRTSDPFEHIAVFRRGRAIRAGETIVAVGFPLRGILASQANVTAGQVSATAGLLDDSRFLQITAPVQQGNSGGPLLDLKGQLVGVVVSKLDAMALAETTGDIPQNVNFAIKSLVVRVFLEANDVDYRTDDRDQRLEAADVGDLARRFTLIVECLDADG